MMTPQTSVFCQTRRRRSAIAALGCAVLLSACHRDPGVSKRAYFEAGDRYFAQQKYQEAVIEYRNAIKYDPKFGEARYRLGQAYMRSGDAQNAFREYIRAADLLPDNADVQLMAGRFLLINKQFDEARGRAQRVLDRDGRNTDAQVLLGNALAGMRDLDGAISEMQAAVEIDPARTGVYTALGQMQRARGDLKGAEATFASAVSGAPKSINARLALGNFYWSVGRLDDAEASFKEATGISASDPLANRALATLYLSTNRAAQAEPFVRVLAAAAKDAPGRLQLADYYVSTSRFDDALKALQGITADDALRAKLAIRFAAIDYAQGRHEPAFRRLDELLKAEPGNAEALLVKGRLLFLDNRADDALAAVKASVGREPNVGSAQQTLGTIYASRHEYAEAAKAFGEAVKLRPSDTGARLQLAQVALATGATDRAAQLAADTVAGNPRDVSARVMLARALLAKGDPEGAAPHVARLVAALPDSAPVQALNGALYAMKHDDQSARRAFQKALDLDAGNIDAFGGLAALDSRAGQLEAAKARVEGRLAGQPDDPALLMLAAMMQRAAHDLPKAEQSLKRIIQVAPSNLKAYSMLAQLYVSQNRLADAFNEFEIVGKRNPDAIGPRTMSAMILEMQGRPDQARERYEAILATNPRSAVAANNLAWYYTEHGDNLDVALQLAQTAKSLLPELAPVNDTLGWIYYKKGLASLAVTPLEQSVAANPGNPVYQYHLGLAYAGTGDKAKARATFTEVIRLKPETEEAAAAKKAMATL